MKTISMWKNVGRFTPPKLPGKIYPSNRLYVPPRNHQVPGKIYPSNCQVRFTPPEITFISTFLPPINIYK